MHLLYLCSFHGVQVFASVVEPTAPKPVQPMLQKNVAHLFERFVYSLQDRGRLEHGLVVFDELDVT